MIGIVGGMGPEAGLDLCRKILANTIADKDQDHIPFAMTSAPSMIEDRTDFLSGISDTNPGNTILEIIKKLVDCGADVIGMPCNTAHSPTIFNAVKEGIKDLDIRYVHLIEEVLAYSRSELKGVQKIGLLCTSGTRKSGVYEAVFSGSDFELVLADDDIQERLIQPSISDGTYGIKACSNPVSEKAREQILQAAWSLADKGAGAIILGCTEIPMVITEKEVAGIPVIDSTLVLARALIRVAAPEKLRRMGPE